MAGIKIDPEMLDIYMELLNKLMAGSETDGGNARLEVSGAGKTEDGLVRYNEEVNKLGDDLRELYGNEGEILGRIRDGTLFKNADKVSVVARSTDDAGVLAKHADEAAAWLHGGKVFRYSDETAEAVTSGEKLLKESGTIYESFADMMSPDDAAKYLDFLANGSREGLTSAELAGVEKADALLVSRKVGYEDVWDLRNAGDLMKKETLEKLKEFNISDCQECLLGEKYVNFEEYLNHTVCGEGMVGENNYLLLWEKNEIEELNDDYETQAFLNNIILIGSDGGDMAYGIDISGKYIEVPFIGMDDEEVKVIAEDFDGFIDYVWNRK